MPEFFFQTHHPHATSTASIAGVDVAAIATGPAGAWLRRVGVDPTRYDPRGELVESGVVTTGQVPMSGLREVFGVLVDATWRATGTDASSACALQVSLDGGTVFQAWTGAAWEEQGADEAYNDLGTLNDHLHELTLLNPRHLGFRVLLTAAGDDTPVLKGVVAYLEWVVKPLVDLRTVLHARLSAARFPFVVQKHVAAATTRIAPPSEMTVDLTLPIEVYNVTDDPLCNVDLFDSIDGSNVVLVEAQAAGSWLEVRASGAVPVIVAHQDEMWTKTTVPSVSVHLLAVRTPRQDVGRIYDHKRGATLRRVRERQTDLLQEVPVRIDATFAEPETADMALEAIRAALSGAELRSPSTGLLMTLIEDSSGEDVPALSEGIEIARWRGRLQYHVPSVAYEEHEGVREVHVGIDGDVATVVD